MMAQLIRIINCFAALTAAVSLLVATAARAQEPPAIPEEALQADHAECMAGCLQNNDEKTCTILCDCTINQFREKLDMLRYRALRAEMQRGTIGIANRIFLDSMGQYCTGKLERLLPDEAAPPNPD